MAYTPQTWQTGPEGGTPITATRLNYMEAGIAQGSVPGPANVLTIGSVTTGAEGSQAVATITGTSPNQTLNLTLPVGASGVSGTITAATATVLAAGAQPTVTLGGTASARTFAFGIPTGPAGTAAAITSASATTVDPGTPASVTVGGTSTARTFVFNIPKGDKGDPGDVAGVLPATEVQQGLVRLATPAEATTGTNDVTAMTPAKVKAGLDTKAALDHGHALTDPNITGVIPIAQVPTGTTATTVALGNHTHTTGLPGTALTTGTVPPARLPLASETAVGVAERATAAEVAAMTSTAHFTPPAHLPGAFAAALTSNETVRAAARGGFGIDPRLVKLRDGLMDATLDTRVVGLGSSTMGGAYTTIRSQEFFQRLAYRAGATTVGDVDTVASNVTAGPMRWWQVTEGGTSAASYYPTTRQTRVNRIKPHYAIHAVGSNDWSASILPATYQANMVTALNALESANPGVVSILIHQQPRKNPATTTYPWSAYADALRAAAALNPAQRIVIDTTDPFGMLDMLGADSWGLGAGDDIHLNEPGHRLLADVVGRHLGIPSEDDLNIMPLRQRMSFTSGFVSYNALTTISTFNLKAAAFPRRLDVSGVIAARTYNSDYGDLILSVTGQSNTGWSIQSRGDILAVPAIDSRLIPSGTAATVAIQVAPTQGAIEVRGTATYSFVDLTINPA